jgi:hypothetical protein
MKSNRTLYFICGVLMGSLLFVFCYFWWQVSLMPPAYFTNYPAPILRGPLLVSIFNSSSKSVGAAVLLDNKTIMTGLFQANSLIPLQVDYGFSAAFSPPAGKHQISVVLGNVGEVMKQEFIQEANITNRMYIYIQNSQVVANRFACKFLLYTNLLDNTFTNR